LEAEGFGFGALVAEVGELLSNGLKPSPAENAGKAKIKEKVKAANLCIAAL
jgi:hypothetical protein